MPWAGWKDVIARTWQQSSEDNVGIVAAGVAFYGFLAMVPMLGAVILTYGLAADPQTVVTHAGKLTEFLPDAVAGLIGEQLMNVVQTSGGKKGLGLLIAIGIAFWGARKAASSIITALNIAYEEEETRSFVRVTVLSLVMTAGAVMLAIVAGCAIGVLAAAEDLLPGLGVIGAIIGKIFTYVGLGGLAAAAAATMFRYAPARQEAQWTWVTPGSLFFAAVWILLTLAFGFYVSNFGNYGATYGSMSAVIVLLTWIYLSSYVLLLAAEINSELEHQTAQDTTTGEPDPLGQRDAWVADHVAGAGDDHEPSVAVRAQDLPTGADSGRTSVTPEKEHPYIASRLAARTGQLAGLRRVGNVTSVLATIGLARLSRRGSAASGAALIASAVGIALLKRDD